MKILSSPTTVGVLVAIASILGALFNAAGTTFAEGGSVPVYLNQEPTAVESPDNNPPDSLPQTFDEGIMQFVILLVICATGLLGSFVAIKHKWKDSDGR